MRLAPGCISGVAFLQNIIAAHGYAAQHLVNERRGGGAGKQKRKQFLQKTAKPSEQELREVLDEQGLNFKTGGSLPFPDTGTTKGRELHLQLPLHGRKKNANAPASPSALLQKVTQGKRKQEQKERKQAERVSERDARILELESQVQELKKELAVAKGDGNEDRDEPVIAAVKNFDHTGLGSKKLSPQDVMALTLAMVPDLKVTDVDPGDGNECALLFPPKSKFVRKAQPFFHAIFSQKLTSDPYLKERRRDSTRGVDYRGWAVTGPRDLRFWGNYGCKDQSTDCRLLLWKDFKNGEIMSAEECIDLVKTRKQLLVSAVPKERQLRTISKGPVTLTHELGYTPLQYWSLGTTSSTLSLEKMIESNYLKLTCYKWQPPGLEHKGPLFLVKTVMKDTEGKPLGVRLWLSAEPAVIDLR
eukprot:g16891.t1